jgi:fatty-acyl-CoA synthase
MDDGDGELPDDDRIVDYEELIAGADAATFEDGDEQAAAAMCYTSGTTARPKGVVYSHRSTVLHSLAVNQADAIALRERDTVMPVVPMFHANAWGLPYAAALAGARQVFPGPRMAPADLAELMAAERVTKSAAVPTVWRSLLELEDPPALPHLEEITCGGSAVPESLIRDFDARFGVPIVQAWGMTETSPLASMARLPHDAEEMDADARYDLRATAGRIQPLLELRIDEEAGGELQVRGPWIAHSYYGEAPDSAVTADGWLRTGDVAELRHGSYINLLDRTKDLVKSGGEWIPSVQLETAIMAHPDVVEAAVVAVPDEHWGERPCACVVVRPGAGLDGDGLREFLRERVARWWIPERVEFIDEVPKTSVGKFDKKVLRARYAAASSDSERPSPI